MTIEAAGVNAAFATRKTAGAARLRAVPPMSQEDLPGRLAAQGVNLDRSAVSRIESQDRYVMDYEAVALAAALKVPVARLLGEKG